jgi:hypothetical protein
MHAWALGELAISAALRLTGRMNGQPKRCPRGQQ